MFLNQSVELARCQEIIKKLQYTIGIKSSQVKLLKKSVLNYESKQGKSKAEKTENSTQTNIIDPINIYDQDVNFVLILIFRTTSCNRVLGGFGYQRIQQKCGSWVTVGNFFKT